MSTGTGTGGGPASRALPDHPFARDDGTASPNLERALTEFAGDCRPVVAAVRQSRLLIAMQRPDSGADGSELALAILAAPDGRATLPVFSCTDALSRWNPAARPVPVEARRAFLAAVSESCELVVVDPGGAAVLLPRPAVWAVAKGFPWQPSFADESVCEAVAAAAGAVPGVLGARCSAGERAELAVHLDLPVGLDGTQLESLTAAVAQRLSSMSIVAERVDSMELKPRQVRDGRCRGRSE